MRWNIEPIFGHVGPLELRWYSVFFVVGLALAMVRLVRAFQERGYPRAHAATLFWLLPLSMLVCAHLVHLVFYEPRSIWERPMRILDLGHGLASHGGALGTILGAYFLARAKKASAHAYLDPVIVASIWLFPWVRIGNFFNSEILGRVTEVPWGVVFERVDPDHARHPVQLYEAIAGFGLLALSEWMNARAMKAKAKGAAKLYSDGAMFYSLLGVYFAYRFALEFFKDTQGIDDGWSLNMGHLLSLGPLAFCGWMALVNPATRLSPVRRAG